jgi:hypothetical protein
VIVTVARMPDSKFKGFGGRGLDRLDLALDDRLSNLDPGRGVAGRIENLGRPEGFPTAGRMDGPS